MTCHYSLLAIFSSHLCNDIQGREDTASSPGTVQLFITCRTTSDGKLVGAWDEAREGVYVTIEINGPGTLGNECTQSERGEFWVVKHASESNVLASFPAPLPSTWERGYKYTCRMHAG